MTLILAIFIFTILPVFLPLLVSISLRELFHAQAAVRYGDQTPQLLRRTTFSPLKCVDFFGCSALLVFYVGWGRWAPVNRKNFRTRVDFLKSLLAGEGATLLLFVLFTAAWLLFRGGEAANVQWLYKCASAGVILNFNLFFINLLPLPVSDMGRFLYGSIDRSPLTEGFFKVLLMVVIAVFHQPLQQISNRALQAIFQHDLYAILDKLSI